MKQLLFFLFLSIAQLVFSQSISDAALNLTEQNVIYDPSYYSIKYPGGDIPKGKGVCTDVIIRTFRQLGTDLQKEIHEDMLNNFSAYPKIWGLKSTDKNIDHRRVPNLMTYFTRKQFSLALSKNTKDYLPGDIVCWSLGGAITHIGIVVHKKSKDGKRNLIVHNIGTGQILEDCLFSYKIIGHYRTSFKNKPSVIAL